MNDKFILNDEHEVVPCPDLITWATWFENQTNRIVKQDQLKDAKLSTVFLGLNHNFGGQGKPVVFESMVFGGQNDQYQERYTSWNEAEKGHERIKKALIAGLKL